MERIFAAVVLGLCSFTVFAGSDVGSDAITAAPSGSQVNEDRKDGEDDC